MDKLRFNEARTGSDRNSPGGNDQRVKRNEKPAANQQISSELKALAACKNVANNMWIFSNQSPEKGIGEANVDSNPPARLPVKKLGNGKPTGAVQLPSQPTVNNRDGVWFTKRDPSPLDSENQLPVFETTEAYRKFGGPVKKHVESGVLPTAPYFPPPAKPRAPLEDYDPYGEIPSLHQDFQNGDGGAISGSSQSHNDQRLDLNFKSGPEPKALAPDNGAMGSSSVRRRYALPDSVSQIQYTGIKASNDKWVIGFDVPNPKNKGKKKSCEMKFSVASWGASDRNKRVTVDLGTGDFKKLSPAIVAQCLELAAPAMRGQGAQQICFKNPPRAMREAMSEFIMLGDNKKNITISMSNLGSAMERVLYPRDRLESEAKITTISSKLAAIEYVDIHKDFGTDD
jgi:hypothetical protein